MAFSLAANLVFLPECIVPKWPVSGIVIWTIKVQQQRNGEGGSAATVRTKTFSIANVLVRKNQKGRISIKIRALTSRN